MSIVYVLGAGFSRAVSSEMPLMKDLSVEVLNRLNTAEVGRIASITELGDDLEAWLTHLSSDQPWLSDSENLRNRSAFYEVSQAIERVLSEAQNKTFSEPMPAWLTVLLHRWKYSRATVLTFNYDEIVERGAQTALATADAPRSTHVIPVPLSAPASRRPPEGLAIGQELSIAFDLLKLHGSISWYYSGLDSPPNDLVYESSPGRRWEALDLGALYDTSRHLLVDKTPLIVPPTAVKNSFYSNKILRVNWKMGASALLEADELHVIGYSAPESDLIVRALLGTMFKGRRILCVNRSADTARKLEKLWRGSDSPPLIETVHGLEDYVQKEVPPIFIGCTNSEGVQHQKKNLLYLTENADDAANAGECPLCTGQRLIAATDGQVPGLSCGCCRSRWERDDRRFFVRGIFTSAEDENGQNIYTAP